MIRTTIDFGIDLGTTNSSVAVLNGTSTDIIKNDLQSEYTPSAVWVSRKGGMYVGAKAREQALYDPDNGFVEFKLQMGTGHESTFARTGQRMRPEELSAEVLKSLKRDVKKRLGEELEAAVITVPAAFELPQCDATNRAARLAGITLSPLLQEPVAAALAYGFQQHGDRAVWLVYDLGGGTFDAAIMQVRDGTIEVINHGGDNHLGGKLIDWEIVNQILIPAVVKEFGVKDFRRGNPRWNSAIIKLKQAAEEAKIMLSSRQDTEVEIHDLFKNCPDFDGDADEFMIDLGRSELESLIEPYIERSLNICKRVLSEKRLKKDSIDKVLLVGGPTLTPYLRQRLEDSKTGLGIPLEFSQDPITVVARGAAIFAGTKLVERPANTAPAEEGQYSVTFQYEPVDSDLEPIVGGKVSSATKEDLSGYTVEVINPDSRPPWRSGKIALNKDGVFTTTLLAEIGRKNTFLLELFGPSGAKLNVTPDRLTYTVGTVLRDAPLTHSVSVALANNQTALFFERGTSLPARKYDPAFRIAVALTRGQKDQVIKVPLVEGESERANRNSLIGTFKFPVKNLKRDLPIGSPVEITIDLDASRLFKIKLFMPLLDEEVEGIFDWNNYQEKDPAELREEAELELRRLEEARTKATELGEARAIREVERIEDEKIVEEVESSLAAAGGDKDAADKCLNRLLEMRRAIDTIEDAVEWPSLVARAEEEIELERGLITDDEYGATQEERALFSMIEREIRAAMESHDPELLESKIEKMDSLGYRIVQRQPGWWVAQLENLEKRKYTMTDQAKAEGYVIQGRRAIANNDLEALKAAVRQLVGMLPRSESSDIKFISSLIR